MKKQCPYLIKQDKVEQPRDLVRDFASPGIVQYFVIDTVTVSLYYMSRGGWQEAAGVSLDSTIKMKDKGRKNC